VNITPNQNSALVKIERQDKGDGVRLHKTIGRALVEKGLAIKLENGNYSRLGRPWNKK
jgi:hypothetical protein